MAAPRELNKRGRRRNPRAHTKPIYLGSAELSEHNFGKKKSENKKHKQGVTEV